MYRLIRFDENLEDGFGEPVQFLGVYVTKWHEYTHYTGRQPEVAFVEMDDLEILGVDEVDGIENEFGTVMRDPTPVLYLMVEATPYAEQNIRELPGMDAGSPGPYGFMWQMNLWDGNMESLYVDEDKEWKDFIDTVVAKMGGPSSDRVRLVFFECKS